MKAAYINKTGPPENIQYGDLPAPKPGPTQCLVKVSAVALNPVDTYIRGGMIQMPLPSPFIIGCDLAGTVAEVCDQGNPGCSQKWKATVGKAIGVK